MSDATTAPPGAPRRRRPVLELTLTLLALVVLQLAFALYYWMPEGGGPALVRPTWELLGLVAALVTLAARRASRGVERAVLALATLIAFGATFLGFAQGFARLEFGYDVAIAIDAKYVPVLFGMMYRADSLPRFCVNCAVMLAALGATVLLLTFAVRRLHAVAADPARRVRLTVGLAVTLLALSIGFGVQGPLTAVAAEQIDLALHKKQRMRLTTARIEAEVKASNQALGSFRLGAWRPDVLVFVVESYGGALFQQEQFADFRTWLADETAGLEGAGYHIRSRYMVSPVFGGSSWMADATLLCGARIDNQRRYAALQQAQISCLPDLLARAGYETLLAAANTTFVDASFHRLFPFTRLYLKDDFGYAGPRYAWSFIPDQYVIDHVERHDLAPRTAASPPLFALYMLTSSHHPWSKVPPYLDDWSELGDGSIFKKRPGQAFPGNKFLSGTQYAKGYDASTRYALHTVFAYLKTLPAERAPLVIVLGDHQPRSPVSDMKRDPWWVPVHVMSRDPAAVERFATRTFVPGITPSGAAGALPLARFVSELLLTIGDPPAR